MARVALLWHNAGMFSAITFSSWQHTSTAFGEGLGCNFRVRVGGAADVNGAESAALQLSRIIDHRSLEKDFEFFRDNAPTLENIAQFLRAHSDGLTIEVDDNNGWRATAGANSTQILFSFTARNARRVFNVEIVVAAHLGSNGMIIGRDELKAVLREHFALPDIDHGLEHTFSVLKDTLLPRKLISLKLRDAVDNTTVLHLSNSAPYADAAYDAAYDTTARDLHPS